MNKRAATSMSVLLLVIMTLVLCSATFIVFLRTNGKISARVFDTGLMEDVYSKSEQINFYISKSIEESIKDATSNGFDKDVFVQELEKDIKRLENDKDEIWLEKALEQAKSSRSINVLKYSIKKKEPEILGEEVFVDFEIEILGKISENPLIKITTSSDQLEITYKYNKLFQGKIS